MNLIYFINLLIIVIIMSYNVFIIRFYDFENFVTKFIAIFLNFFSKVEND